jgi:RNA polymerase II subunit A-like phosphatase
VYHYELCQRGVWYHTKFRPGCQKFLEKMSSLYELHIVTFGERLYAHRIADFMDPDRKYFHDRILSRNEIFNPLSKTDNLKY